MNNTHNIINDIPLHFSDFIRFMPFPAILFDIQGRILIVNDDFTALTGYSFPEICDKGIVYFLGYYNEHAQQESMMKNTPDNFRGKSKFLSAKGDELECIINTRLIALPDLHFQGFCTTFQIAGENQLDIRVKQALEDTTREIEQNEKYIATITHELRTPLNIIIGMQNEMLKHKLSKEASKLLNHARTASSHMLNIVNDVLDLSKISSSEFKINNKVFNLENLVTNVKNIFSTQAKDKNIGMLVDVPADMPVLYSGDDNLIRQVLINIIGNAIKFTDEGFVKLKLSLLESDVLSNTILFEVADTGSGISEEFLNQIFNNYSRENTLSNKKVEGTGLGLHISRRIVRMMGGDIKITSTKGRGTTVGFTIKLQNAKEEDFLLNTKKIKIEILKGKKILLVEDNELNRYITCLALNTVSGFIKEAINGVEAVQNLLTQEYDIILMDLQMPFLDGFEATQIIRQVLGLNTPVLALTANARQQDIDRCISIGINDFLIKPYKENDLFEKLVYLFGNQEKSIPKEKQKLYNLSKLELSSRGNMQFVNNMIQIFIKNTEESMLLLKSAMENDKQDDIRRILHKMIPSVENIGPQLLADKFRMLEKQADPFNHESYMLLEVLMMVVESLVSEVKAIKI